MKFPVNRKMSILASRHGNNFFIQFGKSPPFPLAAVTTSTSKYLFSAVFDWPFVRLFLWQPETADVYFGSRAICDTRTMFSSMATSAVATHTAPMQAAASPRHRDAPEGGGRSGLVAGEVEFSSPKIFAVSHASGSIHFCTKGRRNFV